MTGDDLYEYCQEQLTKLGFKLHGNNNFGFSAGYNEKHILSVKKNENQGLNIYVTKANGQDVKKADYQRRVWVPANDKKTLNKVIDDDIKPRMEIEKAKICVSEIETIARDIGKILSDYPPAIFKEDPNIRLKQLEDKFQTLKAFINTLK